MSMSFRQFQRMTRIVAAALLLGCAAMAQTGAPAEEAPADAPQAGAAEPTAAGLAPSTIEQRQRLAEALAALLDRRTDEPVVERHPDGMLSLDLRGRFQNVMLIRRLADGTIAVECVSDPQAAMTLPSTAPKAGEDR
jgi:hypothetical protein